MKKIYTTFLFLFPIAVFAFTWNVGPLKTYTVPSQVSALVNIGDTVEIDAAVYVGDVCVWNKNDLVIKGVGGRPHLRANGNYILGKGIWVFSGNNITVENIEFSEASVPDLNGAGIRLDGISVTVKNCFFHDNENGILTANNGGKIIVENSEFGYNGDGQGFAHNIYIGRLDTAIIKYNYFHHANIGHEFKSRAAVNYLFYNRFSNEAAGIASREIDLPNGGTSILIGNIVHQGANSTNGNMIGYGLEGLTNTTPHELYLINNTMVNERSAGSFLQVQASTALLKIYNNIFSGTGTVLNFTGPTSVIDSLTNKIVADITLVGFIQPTTYNYQLNNNAIAINGGSNPGVANNEVALTPLFEYANTASFINRAVLGSIDVGAHEFTTIFPLTLLQFFAKNQNGNAYIQWHTTSEVGIEKYILEKSTDGINYLAIKDQLPLLQQNNYYHFLDSYLSKNNYYRLKIIEINHANYYSTIILVKNNTVENNKTVASIFNNLLIIKKIPSTFYGGKVTLKICDSNGAVLLQKVLSIYPNSSNISLPIVVPISSGYKVVLLNNGLYTITLPIVALAQ
jgi:hypothetical protein